MRPIEQGFVEASSTQSLSAESLSKVRSDIIAYRASIGTSIYYNVMHISFILLSCSY